MMVTLKRVKNTMTNFECKNAWEIVLVRLGSRMVLRRRIARRREPALPERHGFKEGEHVVLFHGQTISIGA
jgi:hypothetical protein